MPTWTDQVQAYSALIATLITLGSIGFVITSLRQTSSALLSQNRSLDVSSVLTLFERIDQHWRRYKDSDGDADFEFGQLISYYELSCRLFRDKIFQTHAAITLYEHLHDVLNAMLENDDFKDRFERIRSQPDNYENILWLCSQPRKLPILPEEGGLKTFLGGVFKVSASS